MWQEAIEHVVGCWTNDEYEFERRALADAASGACCPKPMQKPHPPLWGATSSPDGHRQVGELGLGLCSFAVGVPPEHVKAKHRHLPRGGRAAAPTPIGAYVHNEAATFTMVLCAPTREEAWAERPRVVRVVPEGRGAPHRARSRSGWPRRDQDLGNYALRRRHEDASTRTGSLDLLQPRVPRRVGRVRASARPTTASRRAGATRRPASTCCCAS